MESYVAGEVWDQSDLYCKFANQAKFVEHLDGIGMKLGGPPSPLEMGVENGTAIRF